MRDPQVEMITSPIFLRIRKIYCDFQNAVFIAIYTICHPQTVSHHGIIPLNIK
jgi:hypothetical protein